MIEPSGTRDFTAATGRLFDILLQEDHVGRILNSLARIMGETLGVDRALIYDVSFSEDQAVGLTEWLAPGIEPTMAIYPLATFRSTARVAFETHAHVESHADNPHPTLVADGSADRLHGPMQIKTLLWYPFSFRSDGFLILAFNHVRCSHRWRTDEIDFMSSATRHVSMAMVKIGLIEERQRAEATMLQAQKLESLGVLAGGIAHDFNNLMVGVVGGAELLINRVKDDPSAERLARTILHAGQRASSLAGQLLAYAGKHQPGVSRVRLSDVVAATCQIVQPSIPQVTLAITVDEAQLPIDCNASQLEQVILNLVVNAAEACTGEDRSVRVRVQSVDIDAAAARTFRRPGPIEPGQYMVLEVRDTGMGMDEDTMRRIFDPFFTTKRTGRGLGLAAVLGIVKHHGGALTLDTELGRGSKFRVLWPASTGAVSEEPMRLATPPTHGLTVLCIDDDVSVLSVMAEVIHAAGLRCIPAMTSLDGVTLFEANAGRVDCVMLDPTMPAVKGRALLHVLREVRPRVPVVLVGGTAGESVDGFLDERTSFVPKPFVAETLMSELARLTATG